MGFIINPYLFAAATDADADAFISAAGITDSTQQGAIQTLVTDLKGYGIWTKMKAIYPFVGGTSSTHKWNLKDPRDLDAAHRLVFYGGWTHSSTGADPNGTNGYADTYLNNNVMTQNDVSFSVYLGADNPGDPSSTCAIGVWDGGVGSCIYPGDVTTQTGYVFINGGSETVGWNSDSKSRGLYTVSITSTEKFARVRNTLTNLTLNTSNLKTTSFKLSRVGEYNGDYNTQEHRFVCIGDGISSTESANLYTAVQAFQTTLSRNV